MSTTSTATTAQQSGKSRRQVEAYCQTLVDNGAAQWRTSGDGDAELHLTSGEAYRFDDAGVTRVR